jgi:DNA-binding LacI/PurR family transcriptional regulator
MPGSFPFTLPDPCERFREKKDIFRKGYAQKAENNGYSIRLFQMDDNLESALTKAIQARMDGIAYQRVSAADAKSVPKRFFKLGIPIIGLCTTNIPVHLDFDQQESAVAMTEYLVEWGRRETSRNF